MATNQSVTQAIKKDDPQLDTQHVKNSTELETETKNVETSVQKAEIKRVEAEKEAKLLNIMRKKFAEDERLEKEKEDAEASW